ncbi:MFS transporter [Paraherbaspirillum soli]|uniref:MFS transporter n=1 Tax=Paraherbaspirillum soli TaxID=631222 RepID=A0ABW0MC58_9BURK
MKSGTTIIVACSAVFLAQLGMTIYLPALPTIAQDLQVPAPQTALALAAYLIGTALTMLSWASLGERCGRKPVLLAALALYGLTSAALPAAIGIKSFILLRLIQGIGSGGVSVMARVLIRDSFSGSMLAKALSWLSISFVVSLGIGQYLGSLLQAGLGWHGIFYVLAGGALLLMLILLRIPFAAVPRKEPAQASWRIYAAILCHAGFLRPALAGGLGYAAITAFNTCAPLILQGQFHWTAKDYGLLGWPISAAYFLGAIVVNKFVLKIGRQRLMTLGIALMLCGSGTMILGSLFGTALAVSLWLPYCLAIFGQAMNYPISLSIANDDSPVHGPYAMALCGLLHQVIAAAIGSLASLLPHQHVWPLSLMNTLLALAALMCVVFSGGAAIEKRKLGAYM